MSLPVGAARGDPRMLLIRGKGVVSVHVHGGSNLKPMDDTTNVLLAPTT